MCKWLDSKIGNLNHKVLTEAHSIFIVLITFLTVWILQNLFMSCYGNNYVLIPQNLM